MINYGSPIMNSVNNQQNQMMFGMPYPMQQPFIPQPIGNMVNMAPGYNQPIVGNMGQYYTPQTGFYNPYLIQQRQKQIEAQQRQAAIQNAETFKAMSRRINGILGTHQDDIEEHVKRYDPQFIKQQRMTEEQLDQQNTARLYNIDKRNVQCSPYDNIRYNNMMKERERMDNLIPQDTNLADFFELAGEEAGRLQEIQQKLQQRQLNKLYNSKQYNKLLNMHQNSSSYFNSVYGNNTKKNTSLDDMELPLPSSIVEKLNKRKMEFLNSIPMG